MLSFLLSIWLSAAATSDVGWFYTSRIKLDYPEAYSHMIDGPYKTKLDCEMAREFALDMSRQFGVPFEAKLCHERKSA